jgi:hypothetical protein
VGHGDINFINCDVVPCFQPAVVEPVAIAVEAIAVDVDMFKGADDQSR